MTPVWTSIFVSSDEDDGGFDACYKDMPWLALPYEDERKDDLDTHFDIKGKCNRLARSRPVITRTRYNDKGTCASILAHKILPILGGVLWQE